MIITSRKTKESAPPPKERETLKKQNKLKHNGGQAHTQHKKAHNVIKQEKAQTTPREERNKQQQTQTNQHKDTTT